MARRSNAPVATDNTAPSTDEAPVQTQEDTVTQTVEAPVAPESTDAPAGDAPVTEEAIDLGPFLLVAQSAIDSGDYTRVTAAYTELDRKAKGAATRHVNAAMKDALVVAKDTQLALNWSQVVSAMTAPKIAKEKANKEPKVAADSTPALVDRAASLWLAYKTLGANLPEAVDREAFTEALKAKVAEEALGNEIQSLVDFRANTAEDKGDAPTVSDLAQRVVKLAFTGTSGRKASGGTGSVSTYEGPRRSIGTHIAEAFADQESGTFLTVAQIRNFESSVYGTDHPSAGAISSALGGKSLPEGISKAIGGPKEQVGAVKA